MGIEVEAMQGLFLERYPELSFLLTYGSFSSYEVVLSGGMANALRPEDGFFIYSGEIDREIEKWRASLDLEGVDILYVYGLGFGYYYSAVKMWLKERPERALVFLEDDLSVLDLFLKSEVAEEILNHAQVQLFFAPSSKHWETVLEECAQKFPCDRIEVSALNSYAKKRPRRLKQLRMQLMRNVASIQALMAEALYAHKLLENLLPNFKLWPKAFFGNGLKNKFKGVPAIICGAGPSLAHAIPILRTLENQALIFAGGSTIAALSNQGIEPHFSLALDPNAEEYPRLKAASCFEVPLLYANRLLPDVFTTCNGPLGYLKTDTGGTCEAWLEDKLGIEGEAIGPDLGREAFSVTTLAIALACEMGCNPILFNGVDLAYTGMQRYAAGVFPSSTVMEVQLKQAKRAPERFLRKKDIHGHPVYTLVKWVMESECIAAYAKQHHETQFINTSSGGLGFPRIPNQSLSEAVAQFCTSSFDLRAMIHAETQKLLLKKITADEIKRHFQDIQESLKRCLEIAGEMLEEFSSLREKTAEPCFILQTGKTILLESDFEEEVAFECLLQMAGPAIDRLLGRTFHHFQLNSDSMEARQHQLDRQVAKWKQFKNVIEKELDLLHNYTQTT